MGGLGCLSCWLFANSIQNFYYICGRVADEPVALCYCLFAWPWRTLFSGCCTHEMGWPTHGSQTPSVHRPDWLADDCISRCDVSDVPRLMTVTCSRMVFLCVLLLLQSCTAGNRYSYGYYTGRDRPVEQKTVLKTQSLTTATIHRVEKGDTLYSIAFACGEDVRTVAAWNHIKSPYTIYPGQLIRLTAPPVRYTPLPNPVRNPVKTAVKQAKTTNEIRTSKPVVTNVVKQGKISWQWPTKGKIISLYSAKDAGRKGIDIAGRNGQPVYAAAGGVVVYSGDGLRGYGNLIIIKHNDTYFSAYAHNRKLFAKEDQKVNKGQHIADMGSTEADRPLLHFEVRRDGKPVNPLLYLPKRH